MTDKARGSELYLDELLSAGGGNDGSSGGPANNSATGDLYLDELEWYSGTQKIPLPTGEISLDYMSGKDIGYSLGGFDSPGAILDEKTAELFRMITSFKRRWAHLPMGLPGNVADFQLIAPDRLDFVRGTLRRLFPEEERYRSYEEREICIGCILAADETYQLLAMGEGNLRRFWNVAKIKIRGHWAVAVYDNNIGEKYTYVFDAWYRQMPLVFSWEDWPFLTKNDFTIMAARYKIGR